MTDEGESTKPYSDEWKKKRLLEGEAFHPSKYRRRSGRTIQASWLADAVEAGKKIDIENAIVVGPLGLRNAIFSDEVIIRRAVFEGSVDLSYTTFKRAVNFSKTTFQRGANFDSATFESDVFLREARFPEGVAEFMDADIHGVCVAAGVTFGKGVEASFSRTTFHKSAFFGQARFGGDADFSSVKVGGRADFTGATFKGKANFNSASIRGAAFFRPATFEGEANFVAAKIGSAAEFNGATFKGEANFNGASIKGAAFFGLATFEGEANFVAAKMGGGAEFNGAIFKGEANFNGASIKVAAFFDLATFEGDANFVAAKIGSAAEFNGATFKGKANFNSATIEGYAVFNPATIEGEARRVTFEGEANFVAAKIGSAAEFTGARFNARAIFDHAQFAGDCRFVETEFCGDQASFRETAFRGLFFSDGKRSAVFNTPAVNLLGCTYDHIHIPDWRSWSGWVLPLGHVPEKRRNQSYWQSVLARQEPDARQPYTQLEGCCRSAGRESQADNVYFFRRWRDVRAKWFIGDPVGLLLCILVGFGVRRWFLAVWIALFVGLGTLLFHGEGSVLPKEGDGDTTSVAASLCAAPDSCRLSGPGSFWFTLNAFLPVDIRAGGEWEPSTRSVQGLGFMTYESLSSILRIAGWIMIPVGVAAFTGLLQRRTVAG